MPSGPFDWMSNLDGLCCPGETKMYSASHGSFGIVSINGFFPPGGLVRACSPSAVIRVAVELDSCRELERLREVLHLDAGPSSISRVFELVRHGDADDAGDQTEDRHHDQESR